MASGEPASQLPDELFACLHGADGGAWRDQAVVLGSLDRRGRPHFALLSLDEFYAPDPGTLRLALDTSSASSDNLRVRGVLGLCFVAPGRVYQLKAVARELETELGTGQAAFEARIESVSEDRPHSNAGDVRIEKGITFSCSEPPGSSVRARLRELAGFALGPSLP